MGIHFATSTPSSLEPAAVFHSKRLCCPEPMTLNTRRMELIAQESRVKMCFSADGEIMEDNTDYLVLSMVWVVGGSVWCMAGWIPKNHLKLLVQVFPEPGRGTILTRRSVYV